MADKKSPEKAGSDNFNRQIKRKTKRKSALKRQPGLPVWSSFSLFGIVGWSVAIPTLLAIALGIWLDRRISDNHSWTLVMVPVGITIGCAVAWHWISHEQRQIEKQKQEEEE